MHLLKTFFFSKAVLELDFREIEILPNDEKQVMHLKRGVYQAMQAIHCQEGYGVYEKGQLASLRPQIKVFLYRETPNKQDMEHMNILFSDLCNIIKDRAEKNKIDLSELEIENQ